MSPRQQFTTAAGGFAKMICLVAVACPLGTGSGAIIAMPSQLLLRRRFLFRGSARTATKQIILAKPPAAVVNGWRGRHDPWYPVTLAVGGIWPHRQTGRLANVVDLCR